LLLHLEGIPSLGDKYGTVSKGWFIPPETTDYKFYMACDDACVLKLGETPEVAKDPK